MEKQNINEHQVQAIQNFALEMVELASEEGKRFREEKGREPTEQEAERMANELIRKIRIAEVISK